MRLSEYPFVTVRIGCSRCARRGQYRLARLADRFGSEIEMSTLLIQLSSDCSFRDTRRITAEFCGAFYPDMSGSRPPDRPSERPRPRIVGGKAA